MNSAALNLHPILSRVRTSAKIDLFAGIRSGIRIVHQGITRHSSDPRCQSSVVHGAFEKG